MLFSSSNSGAVAANAFSSYSTEAVNENVLKQIYCALLSGYDDYYYMYDYGEWVSVFRLDSRHDEKVSGKRLMD